MYTKTYQCICRLLGVSCWDPPKGHTPTSWDGLLIHHLPKTISRKGLLKTYRYVYVYVYLHTQVHPYLCIYVNKYTYIYIQMYVCNVCMYGWMYGWMHACMYVYIYIYTIHKWIRTRIQKYSHAYKNTIRTRIQKHTHGLFTYVHIHTLGFHTKPEMSLVIMLLVI